MEEIYVSKIELILFELIKYASIYDFQQLEWKFKVVLICDKKECVHCIIFKDYTL
jgi:hypothetical protein